jgi:hypothetical protein
LPICYFDDIEPWLAEIPAVQALRRVWAEQYVERDGQVRWREVKDMPTSATLVSSPYDTDARYSTKWDSTGYKQYRLQGASHRDLRR